MASMSEIMNKALYRGADTTVVELGSMDKLNRKSFLDGKGGRYRFGKAKVDDFIMPGMKQTISVNNKVDKPEISNDMVPQGICCYGSYIFLTAYSKSHTYNAVIYVLDAKTKKYITTLIMHKSLHAGGIEYANGYLWVGDTGAEDTGYLFYYNFSQIDEAIKHTLKDKSVTAVEMKDFDRGYVCLGKGNKASFLTRYKDKLCVGEFMMLKDNVGELNVYEPAMLLDGIVHKETLTTIPMNANGALFCKWNDKNYLIITANNGKRINSRVHIFELREENETVSIKKLKKLEMPCMIEEAICSDATIYFVFESCARVYREWGLGKLGAKHIVGRVCGFDVGFILDGYIWQKK